MTRVALPERRELITTKVSFENHTFFVSVGFEHGTKDIKEVFFGSGMREGTDLRNVASDACVLVSMLLQHGETPETIGKSLSAAPIGDEVRPGSLIAAIVAAIEEEQG